MTTEVSLRLFPLSSPLASFLSILPLPPCCISSLLSPLSLFLSLPPPLPPAQMTGAITQDKLMIPKPLVDTWLAKKDVAAGFKAWLDEFCEVNSIQEAAAPGPPPPGPDGNKRRKGAELMLSPLKKAKVLFANNVHISLRGAVPLPPMFFCLGIPVLFPGSNCKCYVGGHCVSLRSLLQSPD